MRPRDHATRRPAHKRRSRCAAAGVTSYDGLLTGARNRAAHLKTDLRERHRGDGRIGVAASQPMMQRRALPKAELAEDNTTKLVAHGGGEGQAEPGAHGHSQVPEPGGVDDAEGTQGGDRPAPVVCHPVEHDVDTLRRDA